MQITGPPPGRMEMIHMGNLSALNYLDREVGTDDLFRGWSVVMSCWSIYVEVAEERLPYFGNRSFEHSDTPTF